ncbi:MAG: hypothetical protein ACP5KK_02650 [Candidatus Nanoarchaeia archaeon]
MGIEDEIKDDLELLVQVGGYSKEKPVESLKVLDKNFYGQKLVQYRELEELFKAFPSISTVYYPGAGKDFVPIFALKNIKKFIYQDPFWWFNDEPKTMLGELISTFSELEKEKLIKDLKKEQQGADVVNFYFKAADFEHPNQFYEKEVQLFYGKEVGDMQKFLPQGAKSADLIYSYVRTIPIELLPYFKVGAIIRTSNVSYGDLVNGGLFGLPPGTDLEQFGLKTIKKEEDDVCGYGVFKKVAQIDEAEIKKMAAKVRKKSEEQKFTII